MILDRPELQDVVFFVPPLIGGLLGARYVEGRTVRETVTAYLTAVVMGISIGAGSSEYLHLGPWATGGIMFTVASVGHEAFAYIIAALRQGVSDPASTFRKWVDAVLGRRPE